MIQPYARKSLGHIDFALHEQESKLCVVCGRPPTPDCLGCLWHDHPRVTLGVPSIGGLVGLCSSCGWSFKPSEVIMKWRKTAPTLIPVFRGKPIYLVARGRCDDKLLAKTIRDTFGRVPERSRAQILDYVLADQARSVTGKGMRFEALGQWPGMANAAGMNSDRGRAIRLRVSSVKKSGVAKLAEIVAHELAHAEQWADGSMPKFSSEDECERDVESRLRVWGFGNCHTTKGDRRALLAAFDNIIHSAEYAKTEIRRGQLPSNNYASEAISHAENAAGCVERSILRWKGI